MKNLDNQVLIESEEQLQIEKHIKVKKILRIAGGALILVVLFFGFLVGKELWWSRNKVNPNPRKNHAVKYNLQNATISEVKDNGIVVVGLLKPNDKTPVKKVSVYLEVDDSTIIKNIAIPISEADARSSDQFKVKPDVNTATFADLLPNTKIYSVRTEESLYSSQQTKALEIDYLTYKYIK